MKQKIDLVISAYMNQLPLLRKKFFIFKLVLCQGAND